jgi:hypothetical protein
MSILELFCSVDEFWQWFAPQWERELLATGTRRYRELGRRCPRPWRDIAVPAGVCARLKLSRSLARPEYAKNRRSH